MPSGVLLLPRELRSLQSELSPRRLFEVERRTTSIAACFSGPHRLAYVKPDADNGPVVAGSAHVVEVELNDEAASLEPKRLVAVLGDETAWMQSVGKDRSDLLFTARPRAFPRPAERELVETANLYRYSRTEGKITTIAKGVGPLFAISPGGGRVLIETIAPLRPQPGANPDPRRADASHALAVINADGTGQRELRQISLMADKEERTEMVLLPAWRGDTQIVFASSPEESPPVVLGLDSFLREKAIRCEMTLYDLPADGPLKPVRMLSKEWPAESKPTLRFIPRVDEKK